MFQFDKNEGHNCDYYKELKLIYQSKSAILTRRLDATRNYKHEMVDVNISLLHLSVYLVVVNNEGFETKGEQTWLEEGKVKSNISGNFVSQKQITN